jgi:signal transduction histidine kinase
MNVRANILLVDDKPERLLSYEAILAGLDQNLVRAGSGEEALRLLMENDFAAILLDVNMPGMDGFETAALIRDHPRFETTPIIFVTGVHVTDLDRIRGYRMGAVDYVYIPVVPEILRGKVQVLVQLYLQRQELATLNRELAAANAGLAEAHRALELENRSEQQRLNRNLEQANLALAEANERLIAEIAERKRAEELLQEEARRKDEFIAILAHELRNPLAAVRTGVQVLAEPAVDQAQVDWVHGMLERQVQHLICLIDDLLDVSRVTHGRIKLQRTEVALDDVVEHAMQPLRSRIAEAGVSVQVAIEDRLCVDGDPVRLAQVLDNLLSNAVKHTPAGGTIRLSVAAETRAAGDGDWVRIEVTDTGEGIAADMLERVFQMFVQAHGGRSAATHQGLGIGLALVRGIVAMHGGTVAAASDGPGRGATFTVRLPVAQAGTQPKGPQSNGGGTQPLDALRILIIDDNVDSSKGMAICLESAGHEVFMAHDGETGLAAASEIQPDVVLLDIGLPDVDGYQVAARLRTREPLRATPLIAISGFGADSDRRRALEIGFTGYLVKPVSFEALEAMLSEQLAARVTGPPPGRSVALQNSSS